MKIIILLILLGAIMKLPVNSILEGLRTWYCIILSLIFLLFDFGNILGIMSILSFLIFSLLCYSINYFNLVKDYNDLDSDAQRYLVYITELSSEIEFLQKENSILKERSEDERATLNAIVFRLHNVITENKIYDEEFFNQVTALEHMVKEPQVILKAQRIFDNPLNERVRKRQIKQLKEILEVYNLGPSFDRALSSEIQRLEDMNNATNN